ncbi:MAG: protein translocase subunit SecD [Thermoanaerobacterales bacterium]|nr:protein translocase subunit SecD [Bacillota bacterium]MDI6906801.1 protein translocase subunit SecD [Thermoanaerobacterales bacterium]
MRGRNIAKIVALVAMVAFVGLLAVQQLFPSVPWLPWTKAIKLGLDLRGGVHVVLEAKEAPGVKITDKAVKDTIAILEERVNQFGVTEPVIQQQGSRRIIVEVAGVKDPDAVVNTLIKAAFLEFKTEDGKTVLTGKHLKDAQDALNPQSGKAEVNLTFDKEGARIFADVTAANVGRPIGIFLDEQLIQNPVVKTPIPDGKAQITGYASLDEAHRVAVLLRSGALPVKLEVMEKRTVGPTLGADSLDRSITAGLVGFGAILLFMIAYYRLPGLVANFALVAYALIVLLIYVAFKVTMTLPGIAGFLLSLGMAIDANIIIFERLKEELRAKRTLRSAIDIGFKRAFVAIFDANVTTVIAAIVLYYFGTGPIKGFAVTLTIGILVSMFTAITFTRFLLHAVAAAGAKNPKLYRM